MIYLNEVRMMGYLGNDPELRTTQKGDKIVTFNISVNKRKRGGADKGQIDTTWFKVVVRNQALVGIATEYLKKSTRVLISGELNKNQWVDEKGQEKTSIEILLDKYSGSIEFENKSKTADKNSE